MHFQKHYSSGNLRSFPEASGLTAFTEASDQIASPILNLVCELIDIK